MGGGGACDLMGRMARTPAGRSPTRRLPSRITNSRPASTSSRPTRRRATARRRGEIPGAAAGAGHQTRILTDSDLLKRQARRTRINHTRGQADQILDGSGLWEHAPHSAIASSGPDGLTGNRLYSANSGLERAIWTLVKNPCGSSTASLRSGSTISAADGHLVCQVRQGS